MINSAECSRSSDIWCFILIGGDIIYLISVTIVNNVGMTYEYANMFADTPAEVSGCMCVCVCVIFSGLDSYFFCI